MRLCLNYGFCSARSINLETAIGREFCGKLSVQTKARLTVMAVVHQYLVKCFELYVVHVSLHPPIMNRISVCSRLISYWKGLITISKYFGPFPLCLYNTIKVFCLR